MAQTKRVKGKSKSLRRAKSVSRSKLNRPKLNGHMTPRRNGSKKKVGRPRPLVNEVADMYERARWRKERRDYWRNRFRRLVANIGTRSSKTKGR